MGWTIDPTKFGDEVRISHRTLCRRLALGIDQRLVLNTPVDTGRARSNWLASVGTSRSDTIEEYVPNSKEKAGELGPNAIAAIQQADAALKTCPDFPVIYLANNLPYIQRLNEGSSVQAPAGFVEAAIDAETSVFK